MSEYQIIRRKILYFSMRVWHTEQVYYYGFNTMVAIVIDSNVLSGWISFFVCYIHSVIIITLKNPEHLFSFFNSLGIIIVSRSFVKVFSRFRGGEREKCSHSVHTMHGFDSMKNKTKAMMSSKSSRHRI